MKAQIFNIITSENFTRKEQEQALESLFEREYNLRLQELKKQAINKINKIKEIDKRDARIIITSL